jgi:hypothetical protein
MEKADDSYAAVSEPVKDSPSEKGVSVSSISHQPDELERAGFVPPTEEEMNTLRHVPDKIDWSAYSKHFYPHPPLWARLWHVSDTVA